MSSRCTPGRGSHLSSPMGSTIKGGEQHFGSSSTGEPGRENQLGGPSAHSCRRRSDGGLGWPPNSCSSAEQPGDQQGYPQCHQQLISPGWFPYNHDTTEQLGGLPAHQSAGGPGRSPRRRRPSITACSATRWLRSLQMATSDKEAVPTLHRPWGAQEERLTRPEAASTLH